MGSKGGSSGGTTTTTNSSPPPQVLQAYQNVVNQATSTAGQPLKQYTGPLVAGFTPDQMSAMGAVDATQGVAQPYINAAAQYAGNSATPITPAGFSQGAVDQFESPYTQEVVNATQAQFANQNKQQSEAEQGNAISKGAFGGDREGIAQAELANQQALAQAPVIAGLENQGYSQALGEFNTQQQAGIGAQEATGWLNSNAGYALGNLGNEAQNTALTGANAQLQTGALQQQLGQEQLNIPYEQFLQQQAYPFQTTNFLAGVTEGTGSQSGGTSSTTAPAPSTAGQIAGLGLAGAGILGATGAFGSSGGGAGWLFSRGGRTGYDTGGNIPLPGVPDVSVSFIPNAQAGGGGRNTIPAPPRVDSQGNPIQEGLGVAKDFGSLMPKGGTRTQALDPNFIGGSADAGANTYAPSAAFYDYGTGADSAVSGLGADAALVFARGGRIARDVGGPTTSPLIAGFTSAPGHPEIKIPVLANGRPAGGIEHGPLDTPTSGFQVPTAPIGTNTPSSPFTGSGVDIRPTFNWSPPDPNSLSFKTVGPSSSTATTPGLASDPSTAVTDPLAGGQNSDPASNSGGGGGAADAGSGSGGGGSGGQGGSVGPSGSTSSGDSPSPSDPNAPSASRGTIADDIGRGLNSNVGKVAAGVLGIANPIAGLAVKGIAGLLGSVPNNDVTTVPTDDLNHMAKELAAAPVSGVGPASSDAVGPGSGDISGAASGSTAGGQSATGDHSGEAAGSPGGSAGSGDSSGSGGGGAGGSGGDPGGDGGGGDGGSCFLAATPIYMADGTRKPISKVAVGDVVFGFDGLGELEPCRVMKTMEFHGQVVIDIDGVRVTREHPFMALSGDWVKAGDLRAGDDVVFIDGGPWTISAIESVPGTHTVHNIEVDRLHTYVAGGFRVHNKYARGGTIHRDMGGVTAAAGANAFGAPVSGGNPLVQSQMANYTQLPAEKLQELAQRMPPTSPQGALIQRALQQKRMSPGAAPNPIQGFAPTPSPYGAMARGGGLRAGFAEGGDPSTDGVDDVPQVQSIGQMSDADLIAARNSDRFSPTLVQKEIDSRGIRSPFGNFMHAADPYIAGAAKKVGSWIGDAFTGAGGDDGQGANIGDASNVVKRGFSELTTPVARGTTAPPSERPVTVVQPTTLQDEPDRPSPDVLAAQGTAPERMGIGSQFDPERYSGRPAPVAGLIASHDDGTDDTPPSAGAAVPLDRHVDPVSGDTTTANAGVAPGDAVRPQQKPTAPPPRVQTAGFGPAPSPRAGSISVADAGRPGTTPEPDRRNPEVASTWINPDTGQPGAPPKQAGLGAGNNPPERGNWSQSPWLALVNAGARMAASRSPFFAQAAGEGIEEGTKTLGEQRKQDQTERFQAAEVENRKRGYDIEAQRLTQAADQAKAALAETHDWHGKQEVRQAAESAIGAERNRIQDRRADILESHYGDMGAKASRANETWLDENGKPVTGIVTRAADGTVTNREPGAAMSGPAGRAGGDALWKTRHDSYLAVHQNEPGAEQAALEYANGRRQMTPEETNKSALIAVQKEESARGRPFTDVERANRMGYYGGLLHAASQSAPASGATAQPAAQSAGPVGAPDPKTLREGQTGSDAAGKWIVQGGRWVKVGG